ncbi:nuclear receptor coactivator 4 isoform X4 [Betta splendens]|uniref:Nuclear receptor coactivator 4 isoform X4 n=1 Tax=Betta splendens TaxID=158456 RepID=A0A6P7KLP0_BETSP|nr:nuclear receptor coactivator 4 isoform X4 [Betta splendens]
MTSKARVHTKGSRMLAAEMSGGGLKQCQQAQDQLEDAINGVTKAEQQLRENAKEVRAKLQSCVSRQLEALRCREVWLLSQIELLEQVKTETLQQQLYQLHWLRGQFDAICHQLQNSHSSNDLNNQLTSCMEKLSCLSLTPEETPEMSFQADTRSLRQAITSFGCITAQLPEGVSPQRGPVQSCPVTAKTQVPEVAALSDWLLGTCPAKCAPIGHNLSQNPEDWLLSQTESKTSCPVLASVDFMQAWGHLRDLEAWLLKNQTPISRERTSSSCSSTFSIEKIDESDFNITPPEGDLDDWLVTPPYVAMETVSDAERWWQVLKPFEDTWSPSDWLAESSRSVTDCSSCCQTTRAMEIENLGQLKCLKTTVGLPEGPVMGLGAWLQQVVPVPDTCRANELCSSYNDCVCEDNCGKQALSLWLLQQDGRDKNGVSITTNTPPTMKTTLVADNAAQFTAKQAPLTLCHREQEQKVQAILQAWLHPIRSPCSSRSPLQTSSPPPPAWVAPGEGTESRAESPVMSLFHRPLDPELWILPGKSQSLASATSGQPTLTQEEDKWLLRKRSQVQVLPSVCDLFSCMKVGGDKEKWLHKAPVQM